ncbi:hypothetical protein CsatB_026223 [Cannabis sativa]
MLIGNLLRPPPSPTPKPHNTQAATPTPPCEIYLLATRTELRYGWMLVFQIDDEAKVPDLPLKPANKNKRE